MSRPPPSWLKLVLQELEAAIVLLVGVEAGRAPCGGATFDEQRALVLVAVGAKLERAIASYERRSAVLAAPARTRAASLFAATHALVQRASGGAAPGAPDASLAAVLRRFESVCN